MFIFIGVLSLSPRADAATASSKAGAVTTASGRLNVRSSPSSSAPIVTSLNKGSYITLISKSGSWWYVEHGKGRYGYCHSDYITPVEGTPTTVSTQSGSLNVRSGPGTSYAKVGSVSKGETVLLLKSSSGWSRILYHGTKTGYVSTQYLGSQYSALSLNVPSFKQTDSRWANVQIASSGKTMAQIGCATTAIAMMESYRTGTTIYPDAMVDRLKYTPSGSVYWPGHYTPVTNPSGYLSGIYHLLKQGRPVLLGLKNSYGKQHWVVVTGFTGGSSLSASGFTIHDPGSNYRTNLQQLLDLHPVFYKYFYY
jgi:uncharacterized protein YraI